MLLSSRREKDTRGFNTDDGIWRAAIMNLHAVLELFNVSIPMTVFGGLQ